MGLMWRSDIALQFIVCGLLSCSCSLFVVDSLWNV